jgi:redox-sensitive bicupin YhaK (pirin superfamily)
MSYGAANMTTPAIDRATASEDPIELSIEARIRNLGELDVRRVLPVAKRRQVGPFVFFDHMGPAVFPPGQGLAVRPHPHIGLATITYLFEGVIMHRDSLGYVQPIEPGAVNLMTAGRGIVHSERSPPATATARLHGIQSWVALPLDHEEMEPSFIHYGAADLPRVDVAGAVVRVIIGSAFERTSPVAAYSPTWYLEVELPRGVRFELPAEPAERAFYVVTGAVRAAARDWAEGTMAVARRGARLAVTATDDTRLMLLGGESLGERQIWWNFVSSSQARIDQAKRDWLDGRIGKVPGDDEFIPLPDR